MGRFTSGGSGGKSSAKGLTNQAKGVRLDMEGKPFDFPTVMLPKTEYAHVCKEISTYWHEKYKGHAYCQLELPKKIYNFENRSFGDYNIYRVRKRK